tara:strand:- start:1898 stop:2617 length:720 start_codon:yes stop_codon:yes gene_type:complete
MPRGGQQADAAKRVDNNPLHKKIALARQVLGHAAGAARLGDDNTHWLLMMLAMPLLTQIAKADPLLFVGPGQGPCNGTEGIHLANQSQIINGFPFALGAFNAFQNGKDQVEGLSKLPDGWLFRQAPGKNASMQIYAYGPGQGVFCGATIEVPNAGELAFSDVRKGQAYALQNGTVFSPEGISQVTLVNGPKTGEIVPPRNVTRRDLFGDAPPNTKVHESHSRQQTQRGNDVHTGGKTGR